MAERGDLGQMLYEAGTKVSEISNLTRAVAAEIQKAEGEAKAVDALRKEIADLTARRDGLAADVAALEGRRSQAQAALDSIRAKIA